MEGTLDGTDAWFHNPQAQASADYGTGKDGRIYQWVDWTGDHKAWAQAVGNPYWVSIENEGHSGDTLTPAQLDAVAQIVADVFTREGVPFQLANTPSDKGLGFHAMGGQAWGGHFDCPGNPIINQRQAILDRVKEIAGGDIMTDADFKRISDDMHGAIDYTINNVLNPRFDAVSVALDRMKAEVDAIKAKLGA